VIHLEPTTAQFRSFEIIALDKKIAGVRITDRFRLVAVNEPIRHLPMMVDYTLLSDPI